MAKIEKPIALLKLALKYLNRYKRRYGFLLMALIFGFAVVTFITSTKDGMYNNVYYSAQSHYAGDIVALGYDSAHGWLQHYTQGDISVVLNAANDAGIKSKYTVLRSVFGERGVVYFNGNAVMQKYVIGCDWEKEEHLFSKMNFVYPRAQTVGDDGIILSDPVARQLGAVMGDSVILEVDTRWGQKNTGQFIVRGIVKDSSIFGYFKVYVSRLSLNRLLLFDDTDCSVIGFFLDNSASAEKNRKKLQAVLEERIQCGPLVYNRDEMIKAQGLPWSGFKVLLYTMPVYLSEISNLLDAMNMITYFLYGMMLLIIFVSAAVTYRLILHERAREMGIMRAIGFYGGDLRLVLWTEVIALGIISLFAGFLLAGFLSGTASFVSFSWFPSFEIFQKNGKLSVLYLPKTVLFNVALVFVTLICAAFFPSFRASKINLPALLSGEAL
ncbi:MAG: FtsX-like permease family protein [Treponema sp.]|jgi:ABC-type lipoprotein release transport system permease subunit|nr:FtsX-like permease family protein [Treponema sp.]